MNSFGRYNPANFSATNPIAVDTGLSWHYIRIINNSPYLLSLSLGGMGTIDFPEMFLEDIPVTPAYNGKISIVPVQNFPTAALAAALSTLITINAYAPGEIKNPQAQPLTTLSNVGNTVIQANQVQSTGQPAPFPMVEGTPGATFVAPAQEGIYYNDGSVYAGAGAGNAHPEHHWSADNAGNLSVVSVLEQAGNQETGYCGVRADSVTGGNFYGSGTNFKTTMTNTPSSVSLSVITSGTANTPVTSNINKQGFFYQASSTGSGNMFSIATYTTVGN